MPMTVRGHVRSGRLVVDVPTDLPEGSEVELLTGRVKSDPVRVQSDRVHGRTWYQGNVPLTRLYQNERPCFQGFGGH
jgi:hypothetical protein